MIALKIIRISDYYTGRSKQWAIYMVWNCARSYI